MVERTSPSDGLELTVRAVVIGALLGIVFAVGNVYVGLKTGISDNATVTASILGFALCARLGKRPYSALENNITQNVSSSAATMPSAMGFLGSFPALTLMGAQYPEWAVLLWGGAIGLFGIALALPLRKRFVNEDALPFPDAIATAEVINAMHTSGVRALGKAQALVTAAVGSGFFAWFRDGSPKLLPEMSYLPFALGGVAAAPLSLGVIWSPLLVSVGMLIGPRTGLGLFVGATLGWVVVAPWLVTEQIVAEPTNAALKAWLVWPGAALMIAGALTSLARDWRLVARSARDVRALGTDGWRSLVAPAALALAVATIGWLSFGIGPLVLLGALGISAVTSIVVARSIGETAWMPLGSIGRLAQLMLAPWTHEAVSSVLSASIPSGSGSQTGQTLETLKVGKLLGASPRNQIRAQLVGALVGAPFAAGAYVMLTHAYQLGGIELPAPTASPWRVMADLVSEGATAIPPFAGTASIVAFGVGVALTLLDRTRIARFVPSGFAMGLTLILGAAPAFTMAAGALLYLGLARWQPGWTAEYGASVAAGGVVGEALAGILVATLLVTHVLGN
jgi:uncharacterized oligopeptide transporter (OPT) family protein